MLHNKELINAVYETLKSNNVIGNGSLNIVLDPVMVAKGGHSLLQSNAIEALKAFIKKTNPILTPNIPEAEILTGMKINDVSDMKNVGEKIIELGARSVVIKGGHLKSPVLTDILINKKTIHKIESKKIITNDTHGTGCTMASALAAGLAKSFSIDEAFKDAHLFVNKAIKTAPNFGKGNGPINHCHSIN